jgi:CDP-glucose 4,6-dehydratase
LDEGERVVALRRDVDPEARFRTDGIEDRCALALADLTDHDALVRVLNEHEVDAVYHLAAQTIVGTANRSPLATWEANVRGTYTLLEACRGLGGVKRVVVASSDKAYGDHDELPYREDFALQPRYPYDVSKACTDLIARSYANTYDLPVAVTRLANLYGPGDLNWSRIVPDSARALARYPGAARAGLERGLGRAGCRDRRGAHADLRLRPRRRARRARGGDPAR